MRRQYLPSVSMRMNTHTGQWTACPVPCEVVEKGADVEDLLLSRVSKRELGMSLAAIMAFVVPFSA